MERHELLIGQVGRICFDRILEDEDLAEAIKRRTQENGIKAGFFIVIGSLKKVVLRYYKDGKYNYIRLDGPLEIAAGMGNIALDENGQVIVHTHLVVSNEKGEAFGGHLAEGSPVGATAELVLIEASDINLRKIWDEKTNLNLLKLG
jgi:predicted DNA-binding protein with PD1-like motif